MKTIPIPEGLEIPEEAMQSGTFEALAEFTVDAEAGTLTLITVDGESVAEDDEEMEEEEPTEMPDESIESFVSKQTAPMRG